MRKLSESFMANLTDGFLARITQRVIQDKDLDLQIRDNYLNIYYKGNSLLKLSEANRQHYRVEIHAKFRGNLVIPDLVSQETVAGFLRQIPHLKEGIIKYGKSSLEAEYEQLIIRANNQEARNNSEYFVVDRQYATASRRLDLTGVFWDRKSRRKEQEVVPCFMEVKFALGADIGKVHQQLATYYEVIKRNASSIAREAQTIFRQKLELGLYDQPRDRVEAMKTLSFSSDIDQFQFILILVDYNPHSSKLNLENLAELPFANQVKIFRSGFAMWQQNLTPLASDE